jgi:sec-independent protein translocase protein TatB
MFSIPHLIIIFVVVLVVFGPEKLPELARNFGKIMGEFRRFTGDLQHTFEDHLRDIERESSMRQAATGETTIAPPAQNTIGQPKADSASAASAAGTVPSDAPRGWTVVPPNASRVEKDGAPAASSAETPGATQADVAHIQPEAAKMRQEPLVGPPFANAPGKQREQAEPGQASATDVSELGHEKRSDGDPSVN